MLTRCCPVACASTLYCGYSVLGGQSGRTLTSDGGAVLLSVASDGRALSIRWRAYEDARLANAIVLALRRKLPPRMSRADDPLNGLAWCC